jgi:hypothetical protein
MKGDWQTFAEAPAHFFDTIVSQKWAVASGAQTESPAAAQDASPD